MANASKKHVGAGAQGKGSGSGARTVRARGRIDANAPLSNRDKARHHKLGLPKTRSQDSKRIQSDQLQDTESNQGGE
jgi:hypothetical protein